MPESPVLTYAAAVNAALDRALATLPNTVLFGEDIALPGGVFGCTRGLRDKYGGRVFDTPISEAAILGAAVGAAVTGLRPIVEIMYADFLFVAFDQLINQAANIRYVSNGRLHAPLTVRTQQGPVPGACAQHSQAVEAILAHIPGLRVAMPATPQDAYWLLLAAISCEDPTIVLESRALYYGTKEAVSLEDPPASCWRARVVRPGRDVTILSFGAMLRTVSNACEALLERGISPEIVDARWASPLDFETVYDSVRRTSRLVVVHEGALTGGIGAEVAARVSTVLWGTLKAPVERVGLRDVRVPAAPELQRTVVPSEAAVVSAVERTFQAR